METAADRCERKRQREKQRRSDLASAFDVLANILLQVEPGADTDNEGQHVRKRSLDDMNEADSAELAGQSNITRLDLIVETVEAIRRLHSENVKLKNALKVRAGQAAIDDALQDPSASLTGAMAAQRLSQQERVESGSSLINGYMNMNKLTTVPYPGLTLFGHSMPPMTRALDHAYFPMASSISLSQQDALSYQKMADMALQQFRGAMSSCDEGQKVVTESQSPSS